MYSYSERKAFVERTPELYQEYLRSGLSMRDYIHGIQDTIDHMIRMESLAD